MRSSVEGRVLDVVPSDSVRTECIAHLLCAAEATVKAREYEGIAAKEEYIGSEFFSKTCSDLGSRQIDELQSCVVCSSMT